MIADRHDAPPSAGGARPHHAPLARRIARTLWRVVRGSVHKFVQDDGFTRASSVSFYFLLSLIPFGTLGVSIFALLQKILGSPFGDLQALSGALIENLQQVVPFISREWLSRYVFDSEAGQSFRIANFALLPLVSGMVFQVLESSYRKIFQLPGRRMLVGQGINALVSVFAILLLFVTNFILALLLPALSGLLERTSVVAPVFTTALDLLSPMGSTVVAAVILVLFYLATVRIFLSVRIRWRYRLASGALFCGLWLLAKHAFGFYLENISRISVLYGSLSSIIIILLWIYYSSAALLYSVVVLRILHTGGHRLETED
jgi:membrane protein